MTSRRLPRRLEEARLGFATLGRELPIFGAATMVDQAGRLALSLVAAGMLGPHVFGTWVVVTVVLQYTILASLGLGQGAGREVPKMLGAGREAAAAHIEDVTLGGALITGTVAGLIAFAAGPWILGPAATPLTVALLGLAVMLQHGFLLEQVFFRSRLRFRAASVQIAVQGVAGALLGAALLAAGFGLVGLLSARVAILVVAALMAGRTLARVPRPRLDWHRASELIRIGAPMMLAGFILSLVVTADRWIVLIFLGREATGIYGLVGLASSSMILLPVLVSQQFYPRLAQARGGGASGADLGRLAGQQGALAGALTAFAALGVVGAAVILVPQFLPAYVAATRPMLIVAVGVTAYAWTSAYANVLHLLDHRRAVVGLQAAALAIEIVIALGLVAVGLGIDGVAIGVATSLFVYAVAVRRWMAAAIRLDLASTVAVDGLPNPDAR
ncbi:MAG: oligosaccharide flippase family protein [Chloroflexota bacterium]